MTTRNVTQQELLQAINALATSTPCRFATVKYRKDTTDGILTYTVLMFTRDDKSPKLAAWQRSVVPNVVRHASDELRRYILARKLFARNGNGSLVDRTNGGEYRLFSIDPQKLVSLTLCGTTYVVEG